MMPQGGSIMNQDDQPLYGGHGNGDAYDKKEEKGETASSSIKKRGLGGIRKDFKRSDARDDFE